MTGSPAETALAFLPANSSSTKNLAFLDRFGDGTSLAPMHAPIVTTGTRVNPATSDGQAAAATNFGAQADAAATSDGGAFSFIALFKRSLGYLATLAGAVSNGVLAVQASKATWFPSPFFGVPFGANAAAAYAARDAGASPSPYAYYKVFVSSDQPGTLTIAGAAVVNGTAVTVFSGAIGANTPTYVSIPVNMRTFEATFTNGATAAAAFAMIDGFTTA